MWTLIIVGSTVFPIITIISGLVVARSLAIFIRRATVDGMGTQAG